MSKFTTVNKYTALTGNGLKQHIKRMHEGVRYVWGSWKRTPVSSCIFSY